MIIHLFCASGLLSSIVLDRVGTTLDMCTSDRPNWPTYFRCIVGLFSWNINMAWTTDYCW